MQSYSIWVDADSCQSKAKDMLLKTAKQHDVPVIYVANRPIPFSVESPLFSMVVCEKRKDEADAYIIEHCTVQDIVVTRDLPLAHVILEKKGTVMNDRGVVFTQKILDRMLKERELSMQMAALGIRNGKFSTYSKEDIENFSKTLMNLVQERSL